MKTYKSILVTEEAYSELDALRTGLNNENKKLSFSEAIERFVGRKVKLLRLDKRIREYLEEFINECKNENEIKAIILFGSFAKGTYGKFSDVDVFIIVDKDVGKMFEKIDLITRNKKLKVLQENIAKEVKSYPYISPLIARRGELDDFKPIYFDVADYGIILFEKDNVATDFMEKIESIPHKRVLDRSSEMLTWKIKG